MMNVIHAFQEKDTRDELGIGAIRDGLADRLFPGTGTVQTRARYFLFIPWIYLDLEGRKKLSIEIAQAARDREIELIQALIQGEEGEGVIGIEARKDLRRLPSNIYWEGLGTWGIRRFPGSQDQYHRSLDGFYASQRERPERDKGESHADQGFRSNWHPVIPEPEKGWRWKTTFRLTREEARFLRDGILNCCASSLMAHLVTLDRQLGDSEFAWSSDQYPGFPERNRNELAHARNFSEVMHGGVLLYNLMLAEKAGKSDLAEAYEDDFKDWSRMVEDRGEAIPAWNLNLLWGLLQESGIRVSLRTEGFVSEWTRLVQTAGKPVRLARNRGVRELIRNREVELKRGLARLENARALELWNEASGTGRLDFRWRNAHRMANDIIEGLGHA